MTMLVLGLNDINCILLVFTIIIVSFSFTDLAYAEQCGDLEITKPLSQQCVDGELYNFGDFGLPQQYVTQEEEEEGEKEKPLQLEKEKPLQLELPYTTTVTLPCDKCTEPTLGTDSRGIKMVDGGFTFNGKTTDVEYYFTLFDLITVSVGDENIAEFKIYDNYGPGNIRHFEFAYGMDKGQYMSESSARIEYDIDPEGKGTVTIIDPHNVIDDDSVLIETDTVPCKTGSALYDCLLVKIHHTFRAPLKFDIIGTNVWDKHNNAAQNYYNHGISVDGESLNPPKEITITSGIPKIHPARTTVDLIQIDLMRDLWIDKWGYVWHGDVDQSSKIELLSEIPFMRPLDTPSNFSESSDRMHHAQFALTLKEQKIIAQVLAESLYGSFTSSSESTIVFDDDNNDNNTVQISQQQKDKMRIALAELKTNYNALMSEYDARQLLDSTYPYMSLDSNNSMFLDSTTTNDNSLQSLKERIHVIRMLIDQ